MHEATGFCLPRAGFAVPARCTQSLFPQHDATRSPCSRCGEGGMQSAESRTRALGRRGREKKKASKSSVHGDTFAAEHVTRRAAHLEEMVIVLARVVLSGPHLATNSAPTNQYFVTEVFIQF